MAALLLTTLVSGCSSIRTEQAGESRLVQQAHSLETVGNHLEAAEVYLRAAAQATGTNQHSLRLQAVASLIRGEDYVRASQLLDELPAAHLDEEQQQHYAVNRAAIAVVEQHPDQALALLHTVPARGPFVTDYLRLRAESYLQESRFFLSAKERIQLDSMLVEPGTQLENEFAIWEALNRLSDNELQQLRTTVPPDPLSGWMELVELTRLYLQQPDALAAVTPHWQQRYPRHSANSAFLPRLLESMRIAGRPPATLALLLPLTGSLAEPARAIRDGVLAAYYDTSDTDLQPQLQIYDTGDSPETALAAYQQAVAEGARFVLGPLRKRAVQALASQPQLAIPVLALNKLEDPALHNPALYQFGLAPEDEAREVARLAWHEGHTRTIALLPGTEWGERVYAAFASEWQTLGGTILEAQRYDSKQTDHGKTISAALNLDGSKARHTRLSRHLGMKLEFEPRRRQDVDFVFLIASPRQARLIRPQLSFYRASFLPVYATSRVYTGQPDKAKDADMNGIIFCDMPWTLESGGHWEHLQQSLDEFWPASSRRYSRLYALGIDTYRLVPYLGEMGSGLFSAYPGVTGNLSLTGQGHISRNLRCAEFSRGLPVVLEPTAENKTAVQGTFRP